jgi:hypothetical protein
MDYEVFYFENSYILNSDMRSNEVFYYREFCEKAFVLIFEV